MRRVLCILGLSAIALLVPRTAVAQNAHVGPLVYCTTAEQVEKFTTTWKQGDDIVKTIKRVNVESNPMGTCTMGIAMYYKGSEIRRVATPTGHVAAIVRIAMFALWSETEWIPLKPRILYTAYSTAEQET